MLVALEQALRTAYDHLTRYIFDTDASELWCRTRWIIYNRTGYYYHTYKLPVTKPWNTANSVKPISTSV